MCPETARREDRFCHFRVKPPWHQKSCHFPVTSSEAKTKLFQQLLFLEVNSVFPAVAGICRIITVTLCQGWFPWSEMKPLSEFCSNQILLCLFGFFSIYSWRSITSMSNSAGPGQGSQAGWEEITDRNNGTTNWHIPAPVQAMLRSSPCIQNQPRNRAFLTNIILENKKRSMKLFLFAPEFLDNSGQKQPLNHTVHPGWVTQVALEYQLPL